MVTSRGESRTQSRDHGGAGISDTAVSSDYLPNGKHYITAGTPCFAYPALSLVVTGEIVAAATDVTSWHIHWEARLAHDVTTHPLGFVEMEDHAC